MRRISRGLSVIVLALTASGVVAGSKAGNDFLKARSAPPGSSIVRDPAPAPGSLLLFGTGLVGLGAILRKRLRALR